MADVDEYFEKQKQKEYEARLDEEEQKVIRELDEYLSFEGIFFLNGWNKGIFIWAPLSELKI